MIIRSYKPRMSRISGTLVKSMVLRDWFQKIPYLEAFVDIENVVLVMVLRMAMISFIVQYPGIIVISSSFEFATTLVKTTLLKMT